MTISAMTDSRKAANINENRHILKSVAETVLYCGRQCIALRGDNEKLLPHSAGNPGNFLAPMKLLANHDEKLKQHMDKPKLRNATYLSPQTQNEMANVIGKQIIQAQIVAEIKDAQIYTVMVDEVTSYVELMPLCIRFVDKDLNIREEVCSLPRITGHHIATTIKDVLSRLGILIGDCRGQGATNMSSDNVGVQALIRKDAPKAVYMHCIMGIALTWSLLAPVPFLLCATHLTR